ncbi:MAG TPA: glycosyltransferase family 39 protein [Silvibacterium sp.]|nr:glycosyltransferase family 39 protein [Silvibacterium sp.]
MPRAPHTAPRREFWTTAVSAAVVILLFFAWGVHTAKRDSVSWDESQHLYSGWLSWEHGDFGYNPEVPPLIKMWDAIPLLHRDIKQPAFTGDFFKKEGFVVGQHFLAANGIDQTLIPARIMASLLTVFLAALLFFCAREMFGDKPALFALLLFCLDPNFLAHGDFVTTDIGAALTMLAAVYAFYRYVRRPTLTRMIIVGVAVGLTMTAKFTGVFIVPILILIAAIVYWLSKNKAESVNSPSPRQLIAGISVALVIGVGCIWALYHFRYAARPGSLQLNPTSRQYLQELRSPLNRWVLTTVGKLHLLPEAYIYGLADTKISAASLPSYFFGRDYPAAPRWYFPAAFLIKSTLPFLILLGLTIVVIFRGRWQRRREIVFLTVPPLFIFLLCTSSDLGIGYRHLFPIFPMLYILIAGCAAYVVSRYPKSIYAFGVLLVWQFVTTAAARPGLLAYANEAWGGPSKTHLYLSDSNVDWGQQLKAVRQYLEAHSSQPCYFAYFAQGPVDFRDYGINCRVLPTGSALWAGLDTMRFDHNPNVAGTVLISDGVLAGADIPGKGNPYAQFRSIRPAAVIDRGVYVYRGQFRLGAAAALEHVQAARDFAQQHNTGGAIREARTALELGPNNPEALTVLGDALAASGDMSGARSEYTAALHSPELDPAFQKGLIDQLLTKTKQ